MPKSVAEFADYKIVYTFQNDLYIAKLYLQNHLNNSLSSWYSKWKVKSIRKNHHIFSLRQAELPPVNLNEQIIQKASNIRYLGLALDKRHTLAKHVQNKRTTLNLRRKSLYYLLGNRSKLSLNTTHLLKTSHTYQNLWHRTTERC